MEIFNELSAIIQKLSGIDNINPGDSLQDDLALDSLLMVTLLIEIEDYFQIELEESDMNPYELNTVQDVENLIRKYYTGDEHEYFC